MSKKISTKLFYRYYGNWIELYKKGAIRQVTLDKYYLTERKLRELAPELRLSELNRQTYQKLLNDYAETHEKHTTLDFHHHLKAAIIDALDDGMIKTDPTRRVIIKGRKPKPKKKKYLNLFELQMLLKQLKLGTEPNWDWFILLVAKTGLRYAEALALTPNDFNYEKQVITVTKTWNYKYAGGGFRPTKNPTSKHNVMIDWQLAQQFKQITQGMDPDKPIFVSGRAFNSTINIILERLCYQAEIPVISIHGLRHTHASLLLYEGVSVASVAKRLGHANITTTQKTYLHIIQELENKDNDKVMHHLSQL